MADDIILEIEEDEEICLELDGPPVPGATGNGIASIVMNADYTLTINMTDGTSYTTPSIRGEEGNGIASIVVNPDYTMTITMDDGTQYITPDMQGPAGDTGNGIASIVKTGSSGNVDTYTITFTDGTSTTFTVTNGLDGVSPSISVSPITGGHRVTIIDAGGTSTFDVMDGAQGDPGFSPTISVVDITGGHRITITDEYGPHVVDVMDGANGQGVPAGGTTGQVLRKNGNDDFIAIWDREKVTDVQINGSTILDSDGVADIPRATHAIFGLVRVYTGFGIGMVTGGTHDGRVFIDKATVAGIKSAQEEYRPVVPQRQHTSVYYGLAKLAGADMSSLSGETVGVYPEAQKSAISDMLNAPESKSGTTVSITAKSGIRYKCGEVATLDIVVPASGLFEVDFESGSTATVLTTTGATVTWPNWFDPTDLDADTLYEISIQDGRGLVATWPA